MNKEKVLLVEDETALGMLIKFWLQENGYDTLLVVNGQIAKQQLKQFNPNVIISDIMMPKLNGLELLEYVRKELNMETPFIALSSYGEEKNILKAFEMGANDFITKPFSPKELILRIKQFKKRS